MFLKHLGATKKKNREPKEKKQHTFKRTIPGRKHGSAVLISASPENQKEKVLTEK